MLLCYLRSLPPKSNLRSTKKRPKNIHRNAVSPFLRFDRIPPAANEARLRPARPSEGMGGAMDLVSSDSKVLVAPGPRGQVEGDTT